MELIDKAAVIAEIERMIQDEYSCENSEQQTGYNCALFELQYFLNTLKVKEVDLEKAAMNYLLHEHMSPLNEIFHQSDIKAEMQYHKDIENGFKMGFELGIKTKRE